MIDTFLFLMKKRYYPIWVKLTSQFVNIASWENNIGKLLALDFHSSKEILEYVHSDVWGPSPVASLSGKLYYVFLIYDYSCFLWVYFLT